jgi:biotin transport system substrate-specific component
MLAARIFPLSRWSIRLALIVGFALFTGLAAQVRIPLPFTPVPITLQVLAVILSGLLLGPREGFGSQLAYLALILAGAPLAAGAKGGPGVFLGPTAGYLFAFPVAAALVGWLTGDGRRGRSLLAALLGIVVIYLGGASWLAVVLRLTPAAALQLGVAPFLLVDLAKAVIAVLVAHSGLALLAGLGWSRPPAGHA